MHARGTCVRWFRQDNNTPRVPRRPLLFASGALKRAAQSARGDAAPPVGCSIVEAYGKEVKPRELEEVLRLEYRSKLLNPRWAAAMAAQVWRRVGWLPVAQGGSRAV